MVRYDDEEYDEEDLDEIPEPPKPTKKKTKKAKKVQKEEPKIEYVHVTESQLINYKLDTISRSLDLLMRDFGELLSLMKEK